MQLNNIYKLKSSLKLGLKFLLLFVMMLSFSGDIGATHIVGGQLSYKKLEGDIYEISLTFRRDCFNGADDAAFDNPANIWIFNGEGNIKLNLGVNGRLKLNFNPDDTLNNVIMSDCGFEGTQVCVHETTYKGTIRLPYNPGENGYILSYQRCCRNETLANINEPLGTGGTWSVHITPEAQIEGNCNPEFNQWTDVYICASEDLSFDHSATDADGDSLVYKLCTPYSGATDTVPIPISAPSPPYDLISWKDPYGLENLLGGSSPLQIDPVTGLLTGNPPLEGQFLVGICVEEYRDGVKIGEVRRDFQYNVRVCSDPPTAIFEANGGDCLGPEVMFENQSLGGENYQWNFNYPSTDSAFISTEENPTFLYDSTGIYQVQLIVTRGTDECRDEIIQQVAALFSDIDVKFNMTILQCNENGGYTIRLFDISEETEEGFEIINSTWTITQNGTPQTYQGPVITLDIENSDFTIELQTESSTGCKKTLVQDIPISDLEHVADFDYSLAGCPEAGTATIAFGDISDAANPYDTPQGYDWTVTWTDGTEMFTDSSFTIDAPLDDTIHVLLTVDFGGGCMATIEEDIIVDDILPKSTYEIVQEDCPDNETVNVIFNSTSDDTNPLYSVDSTSWTIVIGGEEYTSSEEAFSLNIPKDSIADITLITFFDNGCIDTLAESVLPGPYANIGFSGSPVRVCLGDTVYFVTNPSSTLDYIWDPTEGLIFEDSTDLSNPLVAGIENTQYSVTVTDGICTVDTVVDILVLDGENLEISGDSIVCDGNVTLVASGGVGEGEFIWSLTNTFEDTIYVGETLETSFEGQGQTYFVTFTGESCGDPFAEYEVILSEIYDLQFNGSPVRVCLGDTINLLNNPDPNLSYTWSPTEGLFFPDPADSSSVMVIGLEDTSYDLHIQDDFCELDTMVEVLIADAQNFMVQGDRVLCDNEVFLVASGAVGTGDYVWSLDSTFNNIIYTGDTLNLILAPDSETYYVQYTDKTCGDLIREVTVTKFDYNVEAPQPYNICLGDTLIYTAFNLGDGPLVFEWVDDPHIIDNADTNAPTVGVGLDETEDFELIYIATSETGCVFTDTIEFILMDNPVVDFTSTITECGEYTICFSIDSTYNGFPQWNFGDTTTMSDTSLDPNPCYTYPGPGEYEVVLSNLSPLCPFETVTKTITINDEVILVDLDRQFACIGDSITITPNSESLNLTYTWCNLDGDTLHVGNTFDTLVLNDFQLVLKGVDPNGCMDVDTFDVGPFEFNIETDLPEVFCEDEETQITLTVNGTQDGFSFDWEPEDAIISGGDTGNPILIASEMETFTVNITYDSLGCMTSESYAITTTSFNVEAESAPDTIINAGEEVEIYVIDPQDGYMYEWSTGETDEVITVAPEETTTYTVTVTDEMGCTAIASVTVTVRMPKCDETDVFIPTAFTPNGDGINDVLYVRSKIIDEMELLIYNRWGEEIFRTTDQNMGWDGTYKGKRLSPDVFAYTLRVLCINQDEFSSRGNVSLVK
mgnify:FL=1